VSVVIRDGAAKRLVVEAGDRICATGRFVRFPDGDWLDLAHVNDLVLRSGPWKSRHSFRLVDVDASAVPDGSDRSVIPDLLRVIGIWRDDVITVQAQQPVPWRAHTPRDPLFIGTAPADGWDSSDQCTDVDGLQRLRDTGQIVRDGWLRTDNGALILRVAANGVDAVESVLAPQLPRRRFVVRSRYTATHLREVEQMFAAHRDGWGFEGWSYTNLDAHSQPYAEAMLGRVSASLARWADTLPNDLLRLTPAMTPA
jgi:hypothetical protein